MTDAIVVGGGQNGLAAAVRLAEAGRSVLVLEAADRAGGAVRTEELTLPGFLHDTYSSVYPATVASPVWARMPLHDHGLEWLHPAACYAHPLPGGRARVLYRDLDRTVASLESGRAGDGARWRAFVSPLLEHFDAVRATMLSGFPPLRGPIQLLTQGGPVTAIQFARLLVESTVQLSGRLFEDSGSRVWLHGAAAHGDTPPQKPGGAIAAAYLNLLGHAVGWPSPKGGSQRFIEAIVSYLSSLGGEIRTHAPVVAIRSSGGRVTGVELAGGEVIEAQTVVADVLPQALDKLTGGALPGWYRSLLRRYKMGPATIKVDWALDGPVPWENEEVRTAGTVHLGGEESEFLASIEQSHHRLPDQPFLLFGQQTVADPTRAPAGKHTAWAYTHGPQRGVDWVAEQDAHVGRIEAQVERFAPGFRDRILARHVLGPADLQARNPNLVGGDVGAGSYTLRQVLFRPVPSHSPYTTPMRGLFLGSAATFPGGAVHGVPGDAAAQAALRRSS